MVVRHQITKRLLERASPIDVAKELNKRAEDIINHILLQVGERGIRLSNVLFSIPEKRQKKYEQVLEKLRECDMFSWKQSCRARKLNYGEFKLFFYSKDSQHGDMYIYLRELEVSLHSIVRHVLECEFPHHDDAWWREGVPEKIRIRCATTKETEPEPISDLFAYTNLIDLKRIIDANWKVFKQAVPTAFENNKKLLMSIFDELNTLRNGVMHPIKPIDITCTTFKRVRELRFLLQRHAWRL